MSAGYVYLLVNSSMPGLLKIGRTQRDSRARARKLRSTGVPTPFEVAFEVFSESHVTLEREVHEALTSFRVDGDREFFRYPLKDAIELMLRLVRSQLPAEPPLVAMSIFQTLKARYPQWLDGAISDVQIVQADDIVWLETTWNQEIGGYLRNQTIERIDLAFIEGRDDGRGGLFSPSDSVSENAVKFVEDFGPYSIVMATDLFHKAACDEIAAQVKFQWAKLKQ